MRKIISIIICVIVILTLFSFRTKWWQDYDKTYIAVLRADYSSGDYSRWEKPHLDSLTAIGFQDIGLLPEMIFPAENPYSDQKRDLGKTLFYDPRLSSSGQIACASCHDPELGWGDGRRVSYGHDRQQGKRNSMTLMNIGFHTTFFWDGRANTLEEQMVIPLKDPLEMHSTETIAVTNIAKIKGYKKMFVDAFGDSIVDIDRIQKAIATFERTLVSRKSKFDRFIEGKSDIYTDEEVLGLHLFRTKARCINCHNTPLFSDQQFHNDGLTYYKRPFQDLGRYEITGKKEDVGKFKTGSLREIAQTAPYMHNGLFPSLEGVINLYNAGMPKQLPRNEAERQDTLHPVTSPHLQKLDLTREEQTALLKFLHTLSSNIYLMPPPKLPE